MSITPSWRAVSRERLIERVRRSGSICRSRQRRVRRSLREPSSSVRNWRGRAGRGCIVVADEDVAPVIDRHTSDLCHDVARHLAHEIARESAKVG